MNVDPVMFGEELGKIIREAIDRRFSVLDQRLKSMEGSAVTKALDVEAFDELAAMAERLERLEAGVNEVAEHGFRYRGYWREGTKAKRGDAFTNNGSIWWAVRNTDEKPCTESLDWQVAVRKGRDAK